MRGFIAPLNQEVIKGKTGKQVWNPKAFDFIKKGMMAPDSVNPSLWRQSQLASISGLFKVTEGIYQIRNQDLSNMTIVEGKKGIVIYDPLLSTETAKAALDLYFKHRGKKKVIALIYSHSHADHFAGSRAVVSEKDVKSGKVKIYAPKGFMDHAISENVMAGNTMNRRAGYMYGPLLKSNEKGQVGVGLGMTTSTGTITLIKPTNIISKTGETHIIDGLTYEFLYAPETEAPAEMLWYIKEKKAINFAEDATHTLHNTYTLRGAKIRNPLKWSKYLNEVLIKWGNKAKVGFGMHHWPIFGKKNIQKHLNLQRDMYRFINDQTLRLANQGYTKEEIAETLKMPKAIGQSFSNRGYYGSLNHNVKATYVLYLGWFDGNPATLHPLPPVPAAKKYVEYMGGAEAILKRAQKDYDLGNYRWVAQAVNHVVFADPTNAKAKYLQADALEQLGYQSEAGPWRNFYLTGANELRKGVVKLPNINTAGPDMVRSMTLDLFFDFLAIKLNGPKADGKHLIFNFNFTDVKEKWLVEMVNGVLNNTKNIQSKKADATFTLKRETLNQIILKELTSKDAIAQKKIKISGDESKLKELISYLDKFDTWFNIVTP